MAERFTKDQLVDHAARAIGKINRLGPRGTSMVTREEIEAMATLLALAGIKPAVPATEIHRSPYSPLRRD